MHKTVLLFFLTLSLSLSSFAQFKEGFDKREALDMIAICNSFTFQDEFGDDKAILPKSYEEIYQSESIGLDNKWQLLKNEKYAVINIRGSTANPLSWLANIYSAMIPANGTITLLDGNSIDYYLSDNPRANVHSGWTLAMVFLAGDIVEKIKELNKNGIYHFIITGHSQGAAIAQLLRTYLEHAPDSIVDKSNEFKTYVFASPKPANEFYARNYSNYYSGSSFIINNPKDPIITMPLTKNDKPIFELEEAYEHLEDTNKNYLSTIAFKTIGKLFAGKEDSLFIKRSGINVHKKIELALGTVQMPSYQADMNYCFPVKPISIEPFDGAHFADKRFYNDFELDSTQAFYQHKPYLYFLEIKREYFYKEFLKW